MARFRDRLARIARPARAVAGAVALAAAVATPTRDYFKSPSPPTRKVAPNTLLGAPGPSGIDFRAHIHAYANYASRIGASGYALIRTTDCSADPPDVLGAEIAKLRLRVLGPKAGIDPRSPEADRPENQSDLAKWLQSCYDNAWGLASFLKAAPWAVIYDPLFWQLRWHYCEGAGSYTQAPEMGEGENGNGQTAPGEPGQEDPEGGARKAQAAAPNAPPPAPNGEPPNPTPPGMASKPQAFKASEGAYCPNFLDGERLPVKAGGHCRLHPNLDDIVIEEYDTAFGRSPAMLLPGARDWIILKPGVSPNPEGDGWLTIRFHNNAQRFQTSDASRELFAEQLAIPVKIFKWLSAFLPVGGQSGKYDELEEELTMTEAAQMLLVGENKTVADLLVYPTGGAEWLDNQETRIKSRCMTAFMHTALLADTRASGPTGSSKEARTTANSVALYFADYLAGVLNRFVTPRIRAMNEEMFPGSVPKLKPGETPPRIQFVYPGDMHGDTNPTKDSAPDRKPEDQRPMPEGTSKNEKGNDKVKE